MKVNNCINIDNHDVHYFNGFFISKSDYNGSLCICIDFVEKAGFKTGLDRDNAFNEMIALEALKHDTTELPNHDKKYFDDLINNK